MMVNAVLGPPAPAEATPTEDAGLPVRKVVLIDPREERRAITSRLIDRCPDLEVVGLAGDLLEAQTQIEAAGADVAILEIQLPVSEGLAAIAALRSRFPTLRIVVCSFHSDATTRDEARSLGADGYLTKPLQIHDLLPLVIEPAPVSPVPEATAPRAVGRAW